MRCFFNVIKEMKIVIFSPSLIISYTCTEYCTIFYVYKYSRMRSVLFCIMLRCYFVHDMSVYIKTTFIYVASSVAKLC